MSSRGGGYDDRNRGVLFKNNEKKGDKAPDYTGKYTDPSGKQWRIAGWWKEGRSGDFLSLAFSEQSNERSSRESSGDRGGNDGNRGFDRPMSGRYGNHDTGDAGYGRPQGRFSGSAQGRSEDYPRTGGFSEDDERRVPRPVEGRLVSHQAVRGAASSRQERSPVGYSQGANRGFSGEDYRRAKEGYTQEPDEAVRDDDDRLFRDREGEDDIPF